LKPIAYSYILLNVLMFAVRLLFITYMSNHGITSLEELTSGFYSTVTSYVTASVTWPYDLGLWPVTSNFTQNIMSADVDDFPFLRMGQPDARTSGL